MDLKTITATLALLGSTTMTGCGGAEKAVKTETKTETKVETKTETKVADKPEVKEVTADAKEVTPSKREVVGEMACGEGKCGEGACGGKKTEGDGKAVPVDAAKAEDAAAKPAEKPAEKS